MNISGSQIKHISEYIIERKLLLSMACFHLSSTDLSFKPEPAGASRSSPMMAFQELMQKKFLMGGRYAQAPTITTTTTTSTTTATTTSTSTSTSTSSTMTSTTSLPTMVTLLHVFLYNLSQQPKKECGVAKSSEAKTWCH